MGEINSSLAHVSNKLFHFYLCQRKFISESKGAFSLSTCSYSSPITLKWRAGESKVIWEKKTQTFLDALKNKTTLLLSHLACIDQTPSSGTPKLLNSADRRRLAAEVASTFIYGEEAKTMREEKPEGKPFSDDSSTKLPLPTRGCCLDTSRPLSKKAANLMSADQWYFRVPTWLSVTLQLNPGAQERRVHATQVINANTEHV